MEGSLWCRSSANIRGGGGEAKGVLKVEQEYDLRIFGRSCWSLKEGLLGLWWFWW